MKNYYNLLWCLLILLNPTSRVSSQEVPKIRINPDQAYGGNVSDYFKDIEYIPLETTKESLFGDVSKLIITDDSYIITDNDTRSVLFFTLNGKFIKKIIWPSGTFPTITNNELNGNVEINYLSGGTKVIMQRKTYTIYGEETNSLNNPKEEYKTGAVFLEPGYWIKFNNSRINDLTKVKDTTIYLIDVYKGDSLYNRFLPVNPYKNPGFCYFAGNLSNSSNSLYVQNQSVLLSIPIEKAIYKINKDSAVKIFDVNFPVGIEYRKDVLKITNYHVLDSLKKVSLRPNLIFNLANIFLVKNKLFLKGESPMYVSNMNTGDPNYIFNFMYDTTSDQVVSLERLTSDASSYFLPVFNPRGDLMVNGIRYHKENYYSHISSLDMFFSRNATKTKNSKYPSALQDYFKTQTRKSNPVIVRMKLKE